MSVGSLEELIDENHAIVSSPVGPEYYVSILSFVDKDMLEPGSSVLLHNKGKNNKSKNKKKVERRGMKADNLKGRSNEISYC